MDDFRDNPEWLDWLSEELESIGATAGDQFWLLWGAQQYASTEKPIYMDHVQIWLSFLNLKVSPMMQEIFAHSAMTRLWLRSNDLGVNETGTPQQVKAEMDMLEMMSEMAAYMGEEKKRGRTVTALGAANRIAPKYGLSMNSLEQYWSRKLTKTQKKALKAHGRDLLKGSNLASMQTILKNLPE